MNSLYQVTSKLSPQRREVYRWIRWKKNLTTFHNFSRSSTSILCRTQSDSLSAKPNQIPRLAFKISRTCFQDFQRDCFRWLNRTTNPVKGKVFGWNFRGLCQSSLRDTHKASVHSRLSGRIPLKLEIWQMTWFLYLQIPLEASQQWSVRWSCHRRVKRHSRLLVISKPTQAYTRYPLL